MINKSTRTAEPINRGATAEPRDDAPRDKTLSPAAAAEIGDPMIVGAIPPAAYGQGPACRYRSRCFSRQVNSSR